MSRRTKFLGLPLLVLFLLACATVTQPIKDVQNLAGTAESLATAMPVETLKSFATQMPLETLKAMASEVPVSTLEALPSEMPDFEKYFNPQGTPVSEWNGIPIMPQATAGEEFKDSSTYSFKVNATIKEVQEYYKAEMEKLGWSSAFSMPSNDMASVEMFQKENDFLTVTITDYKGSVVVVLART